jgi:4'-phosphopantetheinyl transferase
VQPLLRVETSPLVGDRRVHALQLLSERESARFDDDPHPERFLTGRMLLRELVAGFTGLPLESITIAASCPDCDRPHARPTIAGGDLHVSLSHAGDRSVAALLEGSAIGVDIEERDASPERLAAIREVAGGGDLRHWTRVEAVLKADGRGLRVDPRAVVVEGDRATLDGSSYRLSEIDDAEFVISVAVAL